MVELNILIVKANSQLKLQLYKNGVLKTLVTELKQLNILTMMLSNQNNFSFCI